MTLTYSALINMHEDWNHEIEVALGSGNWLETAMNLQRLHRKDDTNFDLQKIVPEADLHDWQSTVFNEIKPESVAAWKACDNTTAAKKLIDWFCGRKGATVALLRAAVPSNELKARLDEMVSSLLGKQPSVNKNTNPPFIPSSAMPRYLQPSLNPDIARPSQSIPSSMASHGQPTALSSPSLLYGKLVESNRNYANEIKLYLSDGSWYETGINLQDLYKGSNQKLHRNVPPADLTRWRSDERNLLRRLDFQYLQGFKDHEKAANELLTWFSERKGATVSILRAAIPNYNLQLKIDEMVASFNNGRVTLVSNDHNNTFPAILKGEQTVENSPNVQRPPVKSQESSPVCCVCMERVPKRIILGCFHAICKECHENPELTSCPMCRGPLHPARDAYF